MAIITSYFAGETYGLLGPQMAATIITEHTPYDCIVIAVAREDDKAALTHALAGYFGGQQPVIGFSALSGRADLFAWAKDLKTLGGLTLLAGPQADVDFCGEIGRKGHPHRFSGVSAHFTFALHGPAEQIIPLLNDFGPAKMRETPGACYRRKDHTITCNPPQKWTPPFLERVAWDNLYHFQNGRLIPLPVTTAQVLDHIGCPYAARKKSVLIGYPAFLNPGGRKGVLLFLNGCSFCDVAADKGFCGGLPLKTVMTQIRRLPQLPDGRKIPFELINENPLPRLTRLLLEAELNSIRLSRLNLILRADWLIKGETHLRQALEIARRQHIRILVSSVGFESFDDEILACLNKGLTLKTHLAAIDLMRRLKAEFGQNWGYARAEGANHGFIQPTPWDNDARTARTQEVIERHQLSQDILPQRSIPLIIHHAAGLGDWARRIEEEENIRFGRSASVIDWWKVDGRYVI